MNILDKIESVDEMAARLNVTSRLVRGWCEANRIEAKKVGREWVIVKGQSKPTDLPNNFTAAVKIKGLKSAVGNFNKWTGAARIYFDTRDLEVWTNVYASGNEWNSYHSDSIVQVLSKTLMQNQWDKTSMRELQEICETALAEAEQLKAEQEDDE